MIAGSVFFRRRHRAYLWGSGGLRAMDADGALAEEGKRAMQRTNGVGWEVVKLNTAARERDRVDAREWQDGRGGAGEGVSSGMRGTSREQTGMSREQRPSADLACQACTRVCRCCKPSCTHTLRPLPRAHTRAHRRTRPLHVVLEGLQGWEERWGG